MDVCSVAIGYCADAFDSRPYTVAIGGLARTAQCSVAVGFNSVSIGAATTTIGYDSQSFGNCGIAIGLNSRSTEAAIAIGKSAYAQCANNSIAIGCAAVATHNASVVIGAGVTSSQSNTVHVNNLLVYGQAFSELFNLGNVAGAQNIAWGEGNNQKMTLTGSSTLTFTEQSSGANYTLIIEQGVGGSYTITWPTIKWANGVAPTLSTSAGRIDIVNLMYDGTNFYGSWAVNFT
jgi:hypothetical protein